MSLAELWTAITTVVTQMITVIGSVGDTVLSSVLFQTVFGITVLFMAIGAFRRLINVR